MSAREKGGKVGGARAGLAAGPRRKREAGPRGWGVGLGAGFQGDDLPFPFFFSKSFSKPILQTGFELNRIQTKSKQYQIKYASE